MAGTFVEHVNQLATNLTNTLITNINTLVANQSNINAVVGNATNINTVAAAASSINTVAGSIASINTVANIQNLANITRVAQDLNALDLNGIADVTVVANDLVLGVNSKINKVSADIANIVLVAADLVNINTVVLNIAAINAAVAAAATTTADVVLTHADVVLTHADVVTATSQAGTATTQAGIATTQAGNASTSVTLAQRWASELENVIVTGGLYSAYHWAMKAAASAASFIGFGVTTPTMNGAGSVGTAASASRSDHVHPSDTSKQNTLTFDATPTNASTNPVTSGGIFAAIAAKADAANLANYLLLTGGDITGTIRESYATIAASDIAVSTASVFSKTITGATTFTLSSVPASPKVAGFTLELTNGGSAVVTWWAGIKWTGGTAPTLTAAGLDILEFYTRDGGTTWRGFVSSKDNK